MMELLPVDSKLGRLPVSCTFEKLGSLHHVLLTEQEYNILLEGTGSSAESTFRDVFAGMFLTAAIGAIGVYATTDQIKTVILADSKASEKILIPKPVIWIGVQITIAGVCLFLAIYFHIQRNKSAARKSFQNLKRTIERKLSYGNSDNDGIKAIK